jgi:polysaccharide pyruvyl transferase CsaB
MKIVVSGNYGADNLGDEMILEGVLSMLTEITPDAEITVFSADPEKTAARYNVNSCRKVPAGFRSILTKLSNFYSQTRKEIKSCDYFILGGGGLFTHLTFKANLIWGVQALAAQIYRKPVIMYGQSIGMIKNKLLQKLIKKIFNKSIFIALRDENSVQRLKDLGITQQIHLVPDMAFRKLVKKHRKEKNEVLIALREIRTLSPHFKSEFAEFLNWIIKKRSYHIRFIDFKRGNDRKLHNEIYDLLDNRAKVEFVGHPKYPLINFYEAKYVIGMRLHSIISAIKTATPFLAINYAPKVEGLLTTIKLKKYLSNIAGLEAEELIKNFEYLEKNRAKIVKNLKSYNEKSLKVHHSVESKLKRLLNSSIEN